MKTLPLIVKDRLLIKAVQIEKGCNVHKMIAKFADRQ